MIIHIPAKGQKATAPLIAAAILFLLAASVLASSLEQASGVVLEDVAQGSNLEKAGIKQGDIALSWRRAGNPSLDHNDSEGIFSSIIDWLWFINEQAPRGAIELHIQRGNDTLVRTVQLGKWTTTARPLFSNEISEIYNKGSGHLLLGNFDPGIAAWETVADWAKSRGDATTTCWLLLRKGKILEEARRWPEALKVFESGLELPCEIRLQAMLWEKIGSTHEMQQNFTGAEEAYRKALRVWENYDHDSLSMARAHFNIGVSAWLRGDLATAEAYTRPAHEIATRQAPHSLINASILNVLSLIYWAKGDIHQAREYSQQSLSIRESILGESPEAAGSLNNLGIIEDSAGDLEAAVENFRKALGIQQRLSVNGDSVAALTNLGNSVASLGNYDLASDYYRNALELLTKANPIDTLDKAKILNNLSNIAAENGDLETANKHLLAALEIRNRLAPNSLDAALSFYNLGIINSRRGHMDAAEENFNRSLEIRDKIALGSIASSTSHHNLAKIKLQKGNTEQALHHYKQALDITRKMAPNSILEAQNLAAIGELYLSIGNLDVASDYFDNGIKSFEASIGKAGTSEQGQISLRMKYDEHYRTYSEILLKQGLPKSAFNILERSKARTFLSLLAERDLTFSADIPEDLDKRRRMAGLLYDRTQEQILTMQPKEGKEQLDSLLRELRMLREEYEHIEAEIRRLSPRFASLRYPEPLDADQVRQSLDPGTAVLSYNVGVEKTTIFVITPESELTAKSVEISRHDLQREVRLLRKLISDSSGNLRPSQRALLKNVAQRLYGALIEPTDEFIKHSTRIVIIPDIILNILPWGSLVRNNANSKQDSQYLAEWKPIHVSPSATVYKELRSSRLQGRSESSDDSTISLIAFGDPDFSERANQENNRATYDFRVRSLVERGFNFESLPATRVEVEMIGRIFGNSATLYLGSEATEERAKAASRTTQIIHFATHGILDNIFPLNSAVVLSLPKRSVPSRDNGLLQAWEIFERVRLDADLVVLSACESGLGKEMGGEGLIGLTRAFQYAGARSVIASLWKISDRTTAELMVRFYRHLKEGKPKDEALRAAQMELIRGPIQVKNEKGEVEEIDASAPYYWAAFQVYGDWQ